MPINLEIKAKISNINEAIRTARLIGAIYSGELNQVDTYFNVSKGRLKLREINGKCAELIYYDRDEQSTQRLSDFEVLPIDKPKQLKAILKTAYGIHATVIKKRLLFMFGNVRIHIDRVEKLGKFLEFEVPVSASLPRARKTLKFLIDKFKIKSSHYIVNSYIDLLQSKGSCSIARSA